MDKIVAMISIWKEEDIIEKTLKDVTQYVDNVVVVLEEDSPDATNEIVESFDKVITYYNPKGTPRHEGRDRQKMLEMANDINASWLLCLDADEIFEDKMKSEIKELIRWDVGAIEFQQFNFWKCNKHYRIDGHWGNSWFIRLIKNVPGLEMHRNIVIHCPRQPKNISGPIVQSDIRLKHFGYRNDEMINFKFERDEAIIPDKDNIIRKDERNLLLKQWVD